MPKTLFLLCPTDCLESIIDVSFKTEKYFYASLGNSIDLNASMVADLKTLIRKKHLTGICFILSADNGMILDGIYGERRSNAVHLKHFYQIIARQQTHSKLFWPSKYLLLLLSYYLNSKIKELKLALGAKVVSTLSIKAKIYDAQNQKFTAIYSDLLCLKKYHLN